MKKAISLLLCICTLICIACTSLNASALSLNDGIAQLNSGMLDGECPGALDYVYYAPQTNEGTKYPLVVWLHGAKSGEYKRAQLEWYEFSFWSSEEFQARSADNGMFLLLPRSSKNANHNWYPTDCADLKATIDYFISLYPNQIDTNRIYISGYSTGGSMVYNMLSYYPNYFAAAMPICSLYSPTLPELNALADTSIWLFACEQDPYPTASTMTVNGTFSYLAGQTNRPQGVRYTSFTEAVWPNGSKQMLNDAEHYIWGAVTNDMFMYSGEQYAFSTTRDASGAAITFTQPDGVISWLTQQSREQQPSSNSIFDKIAEFFNKIFEWIKNLFSNVKF